ncbi:MAG: cupredoxin domain-containing protein [Candidatus Nealsonbacteria bacterium]|nr:cupredoxin domain-containing protein [Candidatus Nealsonbacteria bacterium]
MKGKIGIILVVIGGIFILGWFLFSKFSAPESDIVARNGLHWHSNLSINILGEAQDVPAGLGLGRLPHNPMHTHDRDNVIHMEFSGTVREDNLLLEKFFEIWGKQFNKDCIFDKCSGPDGNLKMMVNGKENSNFDNYMMRDDDKIEIIFSASASAVKEIKVLGTEFSFEPSTIEAKSGETIKIIFQNKGSMPHNLTINGPGVATKTVGSSGEDAIGFKVPSAGTYSFECSVPGHKEAGMRGNLIVD